MLRVFQLKAVIQLPQGVQCQPNLFPSAEAGACWGNRWRVLDEHRSCHFHHRCRPAAAAVWSWVLTSLNHEALDVSVEYDTIIVAAGAQSQEVFTGLGCLMQQHNSDTNSTW